MHHRGYVPKTALDSLRIIIARRVGPMYRHLNYIRSSQTPRDLKSGTGILVWKVKRIWRKSNKGLLQDRTINRKRPKKRKRKGNWKKKRKFIILFPLRLLPRN